MWINLVTCRYWNRNQRTHNGLLFATQKEGKLEYETPRGATENLSKLWSSVSSATRRGISRRTTSNEKMVCNTANDFIHVYLESNSAGASLNTWWLDFGVPIHITNR